jgi:glycerophosphoryl diester phosphodiesterase
MAVALGGHRGLGCTDHEFYAFRDLHSVPVENTLASVRAAFEAGADYVEVDAVWSSDGVAFALHNVVPGEHFFGERGRVPPHFLNAIPFDVICAFKTGRLGIGEVASLREVLEDVKTIPPRGAPWIVNIELKGVQKTGQPCDTDALVEAVARAIDKAGMDAAHVLFSSFALANLAAMAKQLPGAHYGLQFLPYTEARPIYTDRQDELRCTYLPFTRNTVAQAVGAWARKVGADAGGGAALGYLHPEISTIRPEHIQLAASLGVGINSWGLFETLDESRKSLYPHIAAACAAKGVPYTAITDYLPEMRALI